MRAPDAIELSAVKCSQCKKYASIWWSGSWQKVDDVLHIGLMDSINYSTTDLLEVQSAQDFLRVFVLSQFCHNHLDIDLATSESPFCPPSPDDVIKMATVQGQAAGFYSIKRKGSLFPQYPHVRYAIDVMDTMYVRRQFRRHGIATRFLDDLLLQFSDDDKNQLIGFSEPISDALLKVLQRYVTNHPSTCDRLWGCSYTGEAGYRWNIHLRLKAEKSRQADVT
jgi:GNAT superfamily N-acetyltransferase